MVSVGLGVVQCSVDGGVRRDGDASFDPGPIPARAHEPQEEDTPCPLHDVDGPGGAATPRGRHRKWCRMRLAAGVQDGASGSVTSRTRGGGMASLGGHWAQSINHECQQAVALLVGDLLADPGGRVDEGEHVCGGCLGTHETLRARSIE
jgi:hypothetical protein